ncbi:MAG: hypothetical protein HDS87_08775 [Bacteroidales bacterium]|nr:hypothetical protein [Bacteroidales bacterium]
MKRIFKIFATILVLISVPVLAGLGIMALWKGIVTTICGFSAITLLQGIGLFLLGQLLSCGIIIPLFLGFGSLHAVRHHRGDWRDHWHKMSNEERREFIQRRREMFGFRNRPGNGEEASKE